jgi:hypothetical protein
VLTHCATVTVEKLPVAKRGEVKKMSDARLISKLLSCGMSEEKVEKMKRDELINAWAEMILAGMEIKEVPKDLIRDWKESDFNLKR